MSGGHGQELAVRRFSQGIFLFIGTPAYQCVVNANGTIVISAGTHCTKMPFGSAELTAQLVAPASQLVLGRDRTSVRAAGRNSQEAGIGIDVKR